MNDNDIQKYRGICIHVNSIVMCIEPNPLGNLFKRIYKITKIDDRGYVYIETKGQDGGWDKRRFVNTKLSKLLKKIYESND
jgi:hypothetical protein